MIELDVSGKYTKSIGQAIKVQYRSGQSQLGGKEISSDPKVHAPATSDEIKANQ
jgi:hypothetical protein